jgi:threonine/homoserine/homoserine lactone efflux protein
VDLGLLARGALLGFTIAAAVGPISLLVIRRTLGAGLAVGLASGLGVATADGLYGAVAAFGLTAVSDALVAVAEPLAVVGGGVLVWLGIRTALAPPALGPAQAATSRRGLVGAWASVLGLTLTNPMTILLFAAIVVNLGMSGSPADAALITLGFFVGSMVWWLTLVGAVAALRTRITGRPLVLITRASGALIALFGCLSVATVLLP